MHTLLAESSPCRSIQPGEIHWVFQQRSLNIGIIIFYIQNIFIRIIMIIYNTIFIPSGSESSACMSRMGNLPRARSNGVASSSPVTESKNHDTAYILHMCISIPVSDWMAVFTPGSWSTVALSGTGGETGANESICCC